MYLIISLLFFSSVWQARNILERHLVIADRIYTMAKLNEMANGTKVLLPTVRDSLNIRVKEEDRRKYSILMSFALILG